MKYLRKFDSVSDMETALANSTIGVIGLAYDNGQPVLKKKDAPSGPDYSEPFYIEDVSGSENTVQIKKSNNNAPTLTIEKSLDGKNWETMGTTSTTAITATVPANGKLYLRCNATQWAIRSSYYNYFNSVTGNFNVGGNINSLLYGSSFNGQTEFPSGVSIWTLTYLFRANTRIISAQKLLLPATTLANNCYENMFYGCTALTTAPALPATTLVNSCYYGMFNGCTSLTTAPALPATALANSCYNNMFNGCTSLTTAPALPATALANSCYNNMFNGCTSLTTAPALPATTLANYCYSNMFYGCTALTTAPALPATTLVNSCYMSMFNGCTSLTAAPALPATTLADECYSGMFTGCTSLTAAPELPATTLVNSCYMSMFNGCTSLTAAPALPATALADICYHSMFQGCTSLITAPALPATTLSQYCYFGMFNGCSNLNYIKCLATDISASNCLRNWVYGVAANGTFVKDPSMSSWPTGDSGIPSGWTVQDAQ